MSIQSNINQSISLMGLLISQSEYAKHTQEVSRAKKNVAAATQAFDAATKDIEEINDKAAPSVINLHYDLYDETLGKLESAEERLFELEPAEKNYQEIIKTREGREAMREVRREERRSKMAKAAEARAKAADAAEAEAERLRMSRMLDLSKLDERTTGRVERAYKRSERDTKYLTKGGTK